MQGVFVDNYWILDALLATVAPIYLNAHLFQTAFYSKATETQG